MTNSERAAYIRGLIEGLELDQNSKEVKVINAMVELLDDLCLSVEELEDSVDLLGGQVDEIDEDLGLLEDDFYDEEDEDFDDYDEEDDFEDYDDFEEDDDEMHFEVTCPSCGDTIELNGAMLDEGEIDCPNCGEKLEFDIDDIEEE